MTTSSAVDEKKLYTFLKLMRLADLDMDHLVDHPILSSIDNQ